MGNSLFKPGTDMVASTVDMLKVELKTAIEAGSGIFVMDMGSVAMIDSRGVGLIIATINTLKKSSRTMRITGLSPDLKSLLVMMGIDHHALLE